MSLLNPIRSTPLLCYVTDRRQLSVSIDEQYSALIERITLAARAGVTWIQVREKDLEGAQLVQIARTAIAKVDPVCRLIINDRLDVAAAVGAAGVHLGEKSISIADAKLYVRGRGPSEHFLIGSSAHSLEAALAAEGAGADYVIFGPVFATPAKASFGRPQGLGRLHEVCSKLTIPVLAIGGITPESARHCYLNGAAGIAGIRIFQEAENLDSLVRQLLSKG